MTEALRSPYPYFGGKSRCAALVWRALGNVPNYVEPFYGSGAVHIQRPHEPKIETVNDAYAMVPNFWRAIKHAPDETAEWCDDPVHEVELHARHRWLVEQMPSLRQKMTEDTEYFDAKIAGWWVWGLSMWIGSGFCKDERTLQRGSGARPDLDGIGQGVHKTLPAGKTPIIDNVGVGVHKLSVQKPHVLGASAGMGVHKLSVQKPLISAGSHGGSGVHSPSLHRKIPDLYTRGFGRGIRAAAPERGPTEQVPALQGGGHGIHAPSRLPNLGSERGVHGADAPPCLEWFRALSARLRRVRVCCGDWSRVVTDSVIGTTKSRNSGMNPVGIYLDPPYAKDRTENLYAVDDLDVATQVADWARDKGDDPDVRIVLSGYEGDYEMPDSWRVVEWKALRGYSGADNENRHRERLWLSPHCLPLEDAQGSLFGGAP